jgi:enoyl-CoA hydratase
MGYELIRVEKDEKHVALVRLNRAHKKNALNFALRGEIGQCLAELEADGDVRAAVITGCDDIFSAGLDLFEVTSIDAANKERFLDSTQAMFEKVALFAKPIISAISGPAFAGGFDLACLCDIRIASETARFQQTEVIHGLTQLGSPHWMCVGLNRIKELAFTGCIIDAQEAFRIGLVNHVYPVGEYLDRALDMARLIASHDPLAVQASKRMINQCLTMEPAAALHHQFLTISRFFGGNVSKSSAGGFVNKEKKD